MQVSMRKQEVIKPAGSNQYRRKKIVTHSTPYMNGGATTRGVFKAYAFFYQDIHMGLLQLLGSDDSGAGTCWDGPLTHRDLNFDPDPSSGSTFVLSPGIDLPRE